MTKTFGPALALVAATAMAATPAVAATRSAQSIPVQGVQKASEARQAAVKRQTASDDDVAAVQYQEGTANFTPLIIGGLVVTGLIAGALATSGNNNNNGGNGDSP